MAEGGGPAGAPQLPFLIRALYFVLIGWWGDVIKEGKQGDHTPVVDIGLRYGMILFIASEVMFFVAWFWAFFAAALFPSGVVSGVYVIEPVTVVTAPTFTPAPGVFVNRSPSDDVAR